MNYIELLKAIVLGIVEGVTEWLPISSTGHMLLIDEFIKLNTSDAFKEMFFVVVQLGAILAVMLLYWQKLMPLSRQNGQIFIDNKAINLWLKIVVASIPAAVVGLLWENIFTNLFYNYQTVAVMLIIFGGLFVIIEKVFKHRESTITSIEQLSYKTAFFIGLFQMIAAVFPGTSRSGSTIIGGLMMGVSRTVAAEFTFFLAIPAMCGASLLKLIKFGFNFNQMEMILLFTATFTAFVVSLLTIKFLLNYIKKHDFTVFGWYRIILGLLVLTYFFCH